MKRNIEVDDCLDEIIAEVTEGVEERLREYLAANPDTTETPDLGNDLDYSGSIHELIDGAVPIYTKQITDLFFLYGNEFEQAFDDAGIGDKNDDNWPMGWKPAAIYCYLESKAHEWYRDNADDIFTEWREQQDAKAAEDEPRDKDTLTETDGDE